MGNHQTILFNGEVFKITKITQIKKVNKNLTCFKSLFSDKLKRFYSKALQNNIVDSHFEFKTCIYFGDYIFYGTYEEKLNRHIIDHCDNILIFGIVHHIHKDITQIGKFENPIISTQSHGPDIQAYNNKFVGKCFISINETDEFIGMINNSNFYSNYGNAGNGKINFDSGFYEGGLMYIKDKLLPHGIGMYYTEESNLTHEGFFNKGKRSGSFTIQFSDNWAAIVEYKDDNLQKVVTFKYNSKLNKLDEEELYNYYHTNNMILQKIKSQKLTEFCIETTDTTRTYGYWKNGVLSICLKKENLTDLEISSDSTYCSLEGVQNDIETNDQPGAPGGI
jgi:hypothetical protein